MLNLSGIRDVRPKVRHKAEVISVLEHLRREIMKGTISRQEIERKFTNYSLYYGGKQV